MKYTMILAGILLMVTGCAANKQVVNIISPSPISGESWEGRVVIKPYSASRSKMVDDVKKAIKGRDDDDGNSMRAVSKMIDKEISPTQNIFLFADNTSCQSKMDYLLQAVKPIMNALPNSVRYGLYNNTATGGKLKPAITNTVTATKQSDDLYLQQLSSDMLWKWSGGYGQASGFVKINVLTKVNCDENDNISFKVSVPDYSISNPGLWLGGQKIAELTVDWDGVRKTMNTLKKEYMLKDGMKEYFEHVNKIANNISSELTRRYKWLPNETSKSNERNYKVDPTVLSSRIQRKLDLYKYVPEKTRYELLDRVTVKGIYLEVKTIIKIFPEEKGCSSVVFNLEYTPILDSFTGVNVFGEVEAQEYLRGQMELFGKTVAVR